MDKISFLDVLSFKKNVKFYIGIIVSFIIFLILALVVSFKEIIHIDIIVRDFAYRIRGEKYGFAYWFFRIATEFGFVFVIIFLFFGFAVSTRFDARSFVLGIGSIITYITNELVKMIFLRERPMVENQWMKESSSSFPSGHSMISMFFYVVVIYFLLHSYRAGKKTKIVFTSLAVITIFLVGLSRIILGVHYFTDVIGGYSLGFMMALIAILCFKLLEAKGFKFLSKYFIKSPNLK